MVADLALSRVLQIASLKASLSDAHVELKRIQGEFTKAMDAASNASGRCTILEKTEQENRACRQRYEYCIVLRPLMNNIFSVFLRIMQP